MATQSSPFPGLYFIETSRAVVGVLYAHSSDLNSLTSILSQHTASLLACSSWLLLHRILLNRGFTLRRKGLSSDTIASLIIGITSSFWTAAVLWHVYVNYVTISDETQPWDSTKMLLMLSELAEAPLLVQILFGFWIIIWQDALRAEKIGHAKPKFWSLNHLRSPFDWVSGLHRGFYWTLSICICISVAAPALASILMGEPQRGILGLAGLLSFLLNGAVNNPYVLASHRYADDMLRIALPTTHHEGTMYILPSKGRGIDAVWSPKVKNEYLEADREIMTLFQHMRSGRWAVSEPLECLRRTLALYQERVILSTPQLECLAAWIYCDKTTGEASLRRIECQRAVDTHLIGRDLIFALCHAEYLVFMAQGRLSVPVREKLGTLRLMSRSGAGRTEGEETSTVGFQSGYLGYEAAVKYVYSIFDIEVDNSALNFEGTEPPRYSTALSKSPLSIDEYVADLWDVSCQHNESTFTALYFFTTVWFMELGNVNGFHIFPLRCQTRDGDQVGQQIAWRQAWYSGLTAQLITASPVLFGMFVLGYLQ
jgi:hypothetical protein